MYAEKRFLGFKGTGGGARISGVEPARPGRTERGFGDGGNSEIDGTVSVTGVELADDK